MTSLTRRTLLLGTAAGAGLALVPGRTSFAQAAPSTLPTPPKLDVPYVPTPQDVVDRMLAVAKVGKNDVVYDLGCGDGRIVVTAAKQFGARGVGIDINPERIAEARANAKKAGVAQRVDLRVANLFETDLSPASVVTLYLLPNINLKLRPQLWKQLRPGTRVVSHAFDMGADWPPEQTVDASGRTIYLWTITAAQKSAAAPAALGRA
jgi:SAM-dependent methyltransferase